MPGVAFKNFADRRIGLFNSTRLILRHRFLEFTTDDHLLFRTVTDRRSLLPEGYFTEAGDKGIKLSGGQRQRICLARELFREPKIMLLDEATSALDIKNERIVQKSIEKLKGKMTTIIITHRLSSIKFCDYVYVINNGKISEEGTYESLIANENSYLNNSNNIKS